MKRSDMINILLKDLETLERFKQSTNPVRLAESRAIIVRSICELGYDWEEGEIK